MKTLIKASLLVFLLGAPGWLLAAGESGVLSQVSGKVQVMDKSGKAAQDAKDGTKVKEGERVVTAADSKTVVRFFDGSQLAISPKSDVQMGKMRKLPGQDKVLHFKLLVGQMMATVQKLASSKSSFEVEAGGVVCGVRGTEFTLQYDPSTNKVNIQVLDGTVWTQAGNETFTYGAGQGGSFTNGNPDQGNNGGGNGNQGNGNHGTGDQGKGGNSFNPFYGFNGSGGDDPGGSLTNLGGAAGDVAGDTQDNGRNDVGNPGVVIGLAFPEYGVLYVPPPPPPPPGGGGGGLIGGLGKGGPGQ